MLCRQKDPHFLIWEPMFHWTDSKIRIHAFYCVLALILGKSAASAGGPERFTPDIRGCSSLSGIQEVTNVFPPAGKLDRPVGRT